MATTRKTFLIGAGATGAAIAGTRLIPGTRFIQLAAGADAGATAGVEDSVRTTCWIGKQDCGMVARRIDGRVIKFEGELANPRNVGTLCPKGQAQISAIYDPNRVKTPLRRTNEKGVAGEWRRISWDEALDEVADRIKQVREKDPELLLWQKGRSKAKVFYDKAFVEATGAQKMGHGAYCSDAGYRASEYTTGIHGVMHPDFRHTKYILSWGWNITAAGGNKTCWITWPQQLLAARERGVRVVHIDPRIRSAGPFADEWVPIRPATDMAMAMALSNRLIAQGDIDEPYLTEHTNSPYLVKEDGTFMRIDGKEQVWDKDSDGPRPAAAKGATPALEGEYKVKGETVRPAFAVFKQSVAKSTPEWAAEICGIDAEQIRQIAVDLGKNAMIGSFTTVDGKRVPYRPVSIMAYHMAQQELGFQTIRAMMQVFMILGAHGAAGGVKGDYEWKVDDAFEELDNIEIADPPYGIQLKGSKFYPINTGCPSVAAGSILDPKKYGVDEKKIPEMMIIHDANPVNTFPNTEVIGASYEKIDYTAVLSPFIQGTVDLYADIVLPAATIEKYEGPIDASDQYTAAKTLRLPPMDPLFESRGEIDIYIDLCERAGILYGEGGYIDVVNTELDLSGEEQKAGGRYALPLDKKPVVRDIFDRWAKAEELGGISFFEREGVWNKGPIPPEVAYGYATDPPFGGVKHRLYGESLVRYRNEMKAKGADEIYWQDYLPLPTWRAPTMDQSPGEYDLYLISFKQIEFKQSRSTFVPMLAELAPKQHVLINRKAAKARGIDDGDEVVVESQNAVTGETLNLKAHATLTETIRPDTVGMSHHYGMRGLQWLKDQGPTPNSIIPTGEGYIAMSADQSFHVKVRVSKT
jgi:anaerobic selenocysteine-containing dehydrogenase